MSEEDKRLAKDGSERLGVSWADAKNYAKAVLRWGKAGFPVRSDEEVDRLLIICNNGCDGMVSGRCKYCGCRVNTGPAISNKARMATEECRHPEGNKWSVDNCLPAAPPSRLTLAEPLSPLYTQQAATPQNAAYRRRESGG
jgi:hypothetical protein